MPEQQPAPSMGFGGPPGGYGGPQGPPASTGPTIPDPTGGAAGVLAGVYGSQFLNRGQQLVQGGVGYFSGDIFLSLFAVDHRYCRNKLKVLLWPFGANLHRKHEQVAVQGGPRFRAPRHDVAAPDLYIPLCAVATYVVLCSLASEARHGFSTDVVFLRTSRAALAWAFLAAVYRAVVYLGHGRSAGPSHAGNMQTHGTTVPLMELVAYAGYLFVLLDVAIAVGLLLAWPAAYWAALCYGTACLVVFHKNVLQNLRIDMHSVGSQALDVGTAWGQNYAMFGLLIMQLPVMWLLGIAPAKVAEAAATVASKAAAGAGSLGVMDGAGGGAS
ncbi:unnamed protein product [Pedinophyceae sp. YPF-701]|nr:unnamed protein product [Pedinophyceae sp. YPF-701]